MTLRMPYHFYTGSRGGNTAMMTTINQDTKRGNQTEEAEEDVVLLEGERDVKPWAGSQL